MKKFTAVVDTIREINEKELSELQKSYREYFGAKMQKFGVKSPAELNDQQKKDFFNEITKDWEKGQGASEAGKKDVEEHGVKESLEINEGIYSKTTKKYDLETAKQKTGQILDIIRSGAGIGFCQINTEGDKAFLIIKADKDDQDDIENILSESEATELTEKDIKSKDDFKAFAEDKLKKQHGDDFDQEKADKVIKGLSDEAEESGDWGAAVGKLNKA
jgi:hypothetical protein